MLCTSRAGKVTESSALEVGRRMKTFLRVSYHKNTLIFLADYPKRKKKNQELGLDVRRMGNGKFR